jgi:glucan phosphoethanolaminetransferase (alkaline phosphatase superfamily)
MRIHVLVIMHSLIKREWCITHIALCFCCCFFRFVLCTICCQFLGFVASSCVPYVVSFFVLLLRLVFPMLSVSLFCCFVLCTICGPKKTKKLATYGTQDEATKQRNWQHMVHKTKQQNQETDHIWYTRRSNKTKKP